MRGVEETFYFLKDEVGEYKREYGGKKPLWEERREVEASLTEYFYGKIIEK